MASEKLLARGTSYVKESTFYKADNTKTAAIGLHSLGSSEQIEIRDFAEVKLSKDTLKDNSTIYIYKNFDCPALEGSIDYFDATADIYRRRRSYTLKEGEYIFYTDKNKAETAYFTTGTLVTLRGVTIPRADKIDLTTIFDSGLQDVPWTAIHLNNDKEIKFTEYQYVTLGAGATLGELTLANPAKSDSTGQKIALSKDWQPCVGDIYYYAATDKAKENRLTLPSILTVNPDSDGETFSGNGWEVCSELEFNVSSNKSQALRNTSRLFTSIEYVKASAAGGLPTPIKIEPIRSALNANPIAFKTNLTCQAIGTSADKYTLNATDAKSAELQGFTIKTFNSVEPLLVKTINDSTLPYALEDWKAANFEVSEDKYSGSYKDEFDNLKDCLTDTLKTSKIIITAELESRLSTVVKLVENHISNIEDMTDIETVYLLQKLIKDTDLKSNLTSLISKIDAGETGIDMSQGDPGYAASIKELATKLKKTNTAKLAKNRCFDISIWDGIPLDGKEYSDIWSRISLDKITIPTNAELLNAANTDSNKKLVDNALKLPVLLAENTYGVASFYVNYTTDSSNMTTWIELPKGYSQTDISLLNANSKWNLDRETPGWSDSGQNKFFLNPGLNCIRINKSCDLFIKTTAESQGEFFFDSLRLVNTIKLPDGSFSDGLNLDQIGYKYVGTEEDILNTKLIEAQLFEDIRKIDVNREFYYNAPIEKNLAIEFNETRTSYDTLMNPNIYYDLNNVNNAFVISKLDIDYLDTGIQIARSSKII
jgi:hypothetical protein